MCLRLWSPLLHSYLSRGWIIVSVAIPAVVVDAQLLLARVDVDTRHLLVGCVILGFDSPVAIDTR